MLHAFSLAVILLGLQIGSAAAAACGLGFMGNVFFKDAPQDVGTLAVLEVTIIDLTNSDKRPFFVGTAKIEKVIKGKIPSNKVMIFVPDEPCLIGFPVGTRGTVIGTVERNWEGTFDLLAVTESHWRMSH
jgi:hypothetical protein